MSDAMKRARGAKDLRRRVAGTVAPAVRDVPPLELTDEYLSGVIRNLPGYDPYRSAVGYRFDCEAARGAINFFAQRIVHVRGKGAGEPFIPSDAQRAWIANLFGWVRDSDGGPRYRTAFLTEARGEGKTTEAAATVLYIMTRPGVAGTGAEVYSAAFTIKQANLVWSQARQMVARDEDLSQELELFAHAIIHHDDPLTSYQSIAAEANSAWGFQHRLIVVDELHAQRTRNLIDALETAKSKRDDSQILYITTAGDDPTPENVCYEVYQYACAVRDGVKDDPTFLPAIYEVPPEADWQDESLWRLAHPNRYDAQIADIRADFQKAKANPAHESRFRQLALNQWVSTGSRWISLATWRECDATFDLGAMARHPCWAGLDLGRTDSLAALALCFPPHATHSDYRLAVWHFMPDREIIHREEQDRASYRAWRQAGLLELTDRASTDFRRIRERIAWIAKTFKLVELAYDRWAANELIAGLEEEYPNVAWYKHGQGFTGMAGPIKEFERIVLDKQLAYNRNPMLDWQINHCAADIDPAGNAKLNKGTSRGFIDGLVASVMAVGRASGNSQPARKTRVREFRW